MKSSATLIAFISAFALHVIIGGLFLLNVDFSLPKDKPKTAIIEASVMSQSLFDDLARRKQEKIDAELRRQALQLEKQARIAQQKREAEAKRRQIVAERIAAEKAKILRQKQETERIQAEELLAAKRFKEKQEAEKAKKIADAKRQKEIEQQVKAEKLAKVKAEAKAKAKAKRIAKEKAAAEEKERLRQAELDKQMEAEFADEFSSAKSAKQLSEIGRYKALIQNKISRNWQVEPNMKGKSCTLAIRLAPDGLILSVKRTNGDEQLCASAERAALKAKTLPLPKDPAIASQFHDFDITLEPDL